MTSDYFTQDAAIARGVSATTKDPRALDYLPGCTIVHHVSDREDIYVCLDSGSALETIAAWRADDGTEADIVARISAGVVTWEDDEDEFVSVCPACGSVIDYCQGHGSWGDPDGAAILAHHDEGSHTQCHPDARCDD